MFRLKLSGVPFEASSVGVFLPESELNRPYSPSFLGGKGILLIGDSRGLSVATSSLELLAEVLRSSLSRPYSPSFRVGSGMTGLDGEFLVLSAASVLELAEALRLLDPSPSLSRPYSPSLRSLLLLVLWWRLGRGKELGGRLPHRSPCRCCWEHKPCFSSNTISLPPCPELLTSPCKKPPASNPPTLASNGWGIFPFLDEVPG